MAITCRQGRFADFVPSRLFTAEWAVVTSGDPGTVDGRSIYMCFAPGDVKRVCTEDEVDSIVATNVSHLADDVMHEVSENIGELVSAALAGMDLSGLADMQAAIDALSQQLEGMSEVSDAALGEIRESVAGAQGTADAAQAAADRAQSVADAGVAAAAVAKGAADDAAIAAGDAMSKAVFVESMLNLLTAAEAEGIVEGLF